VAADKHSFEIVKDLSIIGLANELQVLDREKTLLSSEMSLIESEQALSGDLIALYKAIGGDWICENGSSN
jgi:outer membrane protein TolC